MAVSIQPFRISIVNPRIVVLPGIFDDGVTVSYVAAIMQMRRGHEVVCRWHTDDVDGTLRDFAEKFTFKLDPALHLDRFVSGSDEVHIQFWSRASSGGATAATHVGSMSEDEFFGAVEDARHWHYAWCASNTQLVGHND